ncbi:MAG: SRPBCC domain-containing protein [Candidatus Shapirobacteria bacterium]|jgi:uncharacterized protein YndB with AHSA1/START domain
MMITVDTLISSPLEKVWNNWIDPQAVMKWNHASEDWYCPKASNDFTPGGRFSYTMSSTDDKQSFDFTGMYTGIVSQKEIETKLDDGRVVTVSFESVDDNNTIVTETFETEETNSVDLQRTGWQAILDNFKKYCEEK